jgi:hypothetical protein
MGTLAHAATTVLATGGGASCCTDEGGCSPTTLEVEESFGSLLYAAGDRDSLAGYGRGFEVGLWQPDSCGRAQGR